MLRIEALEIDDHILNKLESRHGVPFRELEEVRRGRQGLYKIFSQTETGRHLLVVLADLGGGVWKVVTAREMTDQERRLYRRERRD